MNWKFYLQPEELWEAMLADFEEAKVSIDCEQYIFNIDDTGRRFIDCLIKKAKEGVRVRLLLDAMGSCYLFVSLYPKELAAAGIEVAFFNPVSPWRVYNATSWFLRDHRKISVIDSRVGYTGGAAIDSAQRGWRDTNVRVEGMVVKEMEEAFIRLWEKTKNGRAPKIKRNTTKAIESAVEPLHFLTNAPRFREREVYHYLLRAIRRAERYVYLTTPYFVPSVRLFAGLIRAAKRRVDVRILVPEVSDVRTVDVAAGSYFTIALKSRVKIFRYKNRVLHAKTSVIDDAQATVGSTNLDNISLLFNYEGDVWGGAPQFVEEVKSRFLADIKNAEELTLENWSRRPLRRKVLEALSWPIHELL